MANYDYNSNHHDPQSHPDIVPPAETIPERPKFSMKYHKHLCLWLLWVIFAVNLAFAYAKLTAMEGHSSVLIYQIAPEIEIVDKVSGILMIFVAALAVWARFSLKAYKKSGPRILYSIYICNLIINVVVTIWSSAIAANHANMIFSGNLITATVLPLVWLIINVTYFSKRKELFVK